MRLGLLVRRLNQLQWAEPVAREAHRRGHAVALVLDQRAPRTGPKAALWPDAAAVPVRWSSWLAAVERYDREQSYDAWVVPGPIAWQRDELPTLCVRTALQTSVSDVLRLQSASWSRVYTWSVAWERFYAEANGGPHHSRLSFDGRDPRFHPVGHPLLDHLAWLDHDRTRWTWALPSGQPIILYLPFPFGAHAQSWRLRWGYRWSPWGDRAVVRAVRAYADRHGALLVVCARAKVAVPGYLRQAADRFIAGEDPRDEPIVLRLLALPETRLFVHHLSSAVTMAVACGVEAFGIAPPHRWTAYENRGPAFDWEAFNDGFYSKVGMGRPAGTMAWLRNRHLMPSRPAATDTRRSSYLARFTGSEPFQAGARIVDDLERRVG